MLLRLHAVVVLVLFVFFGYKLLLLLTGRQETLRHLRARTRWADSALLGAALLSGFGAWLAFPEPLSGWSLLPAGMTLVALLLFIDRVRREQAAWAAWQLVAAAVVYSVPAYGVLANAWPHQPNTMQQAVLGAAPNTPALTTRSGQAEATATPDAAAPIDTTTISATYLATINSAQAAENDPATTPAVLTAGKVLYTQNCAVCHGADGRLGLNGARDLTKSNLNDAGRVYQVTHGSISKKMPAFQGRLTEEQIRQVVEYSLTLR